MTKTLGVEDYVEVFLAGVKAHYNEVLKEDSPTNPNRGLYKNITDTASNNLRSAFAKFTSEVKTFSTAIEKIDSALSPLSGLAIRHGGQEATIAAIRDLQRTLSDIRNLLSTMCYGKT